MTAADPQGQDLKGQDPKCQHPNGLGPVGQVRIYQGAQHRFIWPVHLAGWLELGWTTEPGVAPRATPTVTSAPRKKRASSSSSPSGVNPVGVGSAKADEPLPVLVTDFLVDPSVPTDA